LAWGSRYCDDSAFDEAATEIHYRNSQDLYGGSTTETAGISAGDPLPMPGSSPASLRPCVFAFISPKEPYARSPHSPPNLLLPPAGEGETSFYCDAEYEKKPEPCGAPKAGVRRR